MIDQLDKILNHATEHRRFTAAVAVLQTLIPIQAVLVEGETSVSLAIKYADALLAALEEKK